MLSFFLNKNFLLIFQTLLERLEKFSKLPFGSFFFNFLCYYLTMIFFIRDIFGYETENKPIAKFYPILVGFILSCLSFINLISPFGLMFYLLLHGCHLISIEITGIIFATYFSKNPNSFLTKFYAEFIKKKSTITNKIFIRNIFGRAAFGAAFLGKSGLTPSGRAVIYAGVLTGGAVLINGELDRRHRTQEAIKQREFDAWKVNVEIWHRTPYNERDGFASKPPKN